MSGPATRVTAGISRGRLLKTPPGRATRPTTAMVREALFNIIGDSIRGARVLDLFAGAGTLGIEALSRGATHATFVERGPHAGDLTSYNLLLLDPPYRDSGGLISALQALDHSLLRDQALLVVEHHRSQPIPPLERLVHVRDRNYGTTRLTFFRYI
ncbi:MAG: 16S rRNA (guanine(966)-N(2))-methyltransferase RsmD [Chloroflexi bacterium]|nr:MAG: 16S rRNA (guanine(966)-N(2))-methyltransferase RsmD [Chloroflexota bacterium]